MAKYMCEAKDCLEPASARREYVTFSGMVAYGIELEDQDLSFYLCDAHAKEFHDAQT